MDWARSHPDRIAVIVAAFFLTVSAVLIANSALHFGDTFASIQTVRAPKPATPPAKAAELDGALQQLRQPAQWTASSRSGLFVPEKHFIGANGMPATLMNTEVHPPVPNEWLDQFGLPIADSDVLTQDADNDGFNNLEEWQAHTNPTDNKSHPSYVTKLRMKSFVQEPFKFMFASSVGDTFALNSVDHSQPTQFLKLGEPLKGTKFKVAKFEEKMVKNQYGTEIDVSELNLENVETGEQITLVKEKPTISPESVVTFVYAIGDRREFAVKKDQEFTLKPEEEIKYKLVDVQPTKAVIVNTQTKERLEVGLVTP